jgi:hypothetical protein
MRSTDRERSSVYQILGRRVVTVVGQGGVERLEPDLKPLEVPALSPMGGLSLDFLLQPLRLLLLQLGAIHPLGLVIAVEAVDLEGEAALAERPLLVALFASKTTRPAAAGPTPFCCHRACDRGAVDWLEWILSLTGCVLERGWEQKMVSVGGK